MGDQRRSTSKEQDSRNLNNGDGDNPRKLGNHNGGSFADMFDTPPDEWTSDEWILLLALLIVCIAGCCCFCCMCAMPLCCGGYGGSSGGYGGSSGCSCLRDIICCYCLYQMCCDDQMMDQAFSEEL